MVSRLIAFVVWALVAGGAVFWTLRLSAQPLSVPAHAAPVVAQMGSPAAVSRMLGGGPERAPEQAAPPPESARFKLIGVMAPRSGSTGPGVALLSIDGKPPKAFALGGRIEGDLTVQSLSLRAATIGRGESGSSFTLELPPPAPAQTGDLPAIPPDQGAAAADSMPPEGSQPPPGEQPQ
ncbi:hypothetical protein OOT46_18760 [Aquabacterium sp. A7-Y]|uniref:hypothetical protein n=1 Tax=Aquabacterium sp. A7-Y TaxID=1349605 RepID=UPI00223E4F91|nr:hypothetical protein [Aquabacterium sp. A7-Y]MCW7539880.1 hypothetical protein [Aquabacterium sp. A7-Y]